MHAVVQPAAASDPAAAAASAAGSVLQSAVLVGSAAVASAAAAGGGGGGAAAADTAAAGEDPAPAIPKQRGRKEKAKKNGKWDEEHDDVCVPAWHGDFRKRPWKIKVTKDGQHKGYQWEGTRESMDQLKATDMTLFSCRLAEMAGASKKL